MKSLFYLFAASLMFMTPPSARAAEFCKDKAPAENIFSGGPSNLGILKNRQLIYFYKQKNNNPRASLRYEKATAKIKQR